MSANLRETLAQIMGDSPAVTFDQALGHIPESGIVYAKNREGRLCVMVYVGQSSVAQTLMFPTLEERFDEKDRMVFRSLASVMLEYYYRQMRAIYLSARISAEDIPSPGVLLREAVRDLPKGVHDHVVNEMVNGLAGLRNSVLVLNAAGDAFWAWLDTRAGQSAMKVEKLDKSKVTERHLMAAMYWRVVMSYVQLGGENKYSLLALRMWERLGNFLWEMDGQPTLVLMC
jgi:hypothetical protein